MSDKTRASWIPATKTRLLLRQRHGNGTGKSPFEHWHNRQFRRSAAFEPSASRDVHAYRCISAGIQDRVAARAMRMQLFCRFDTLTTVSASGGYPASFSIGQRRRSAIRRKLSNAMSSTGFGCGQSDESPSLPLPNWPSRAVDLWTLRHDPDTKLAGRWQREV
jgi:hypothetical protein